MITNQDFQIKCTDLKIEFKKPALEYGTVPDPVFLTNINFSNLILTLSN